MTAFNVTLTNPGAESGSSTGWTMRTGTGPGVRTVDTGVVPNAGSYYFCGSDTAASAKWDQQIAIDPSLHSAIDGGGFTLIGRAYHNGFSGDADTGALYVECYE